MERHFNNRLKRTSFRYGGETWIWIAGLALLAWLPGLAGFSSQGPQDYCQFQDFNAHCSGHQVVLMESARYGRLQLGRCVDRDYGYIGCSANVLDLLDRACSGFSTCNFSIPALRDLVQPCPKDLTSYLEAGFTCVPVLPHKPTQRHSCNSTNPIRLIGGSSHISSMDAIEKGIAVERCPVRIEAAQGQKVNFSVMTFGSFMEWDDMDTDLSHRNCPVHVIIKDLAKKGHRQIRKDISLCQTKHRLESLYLSNGSYVDLYFQFRKGAGTKTRFLIKYEVTGCSDILPPPGAHVARIDDRAIVRCNHSQETWYLTCQGNAWIGSVTNCTAYQAPTNGEQITTKKKSIPFGLVVAVTIGVILGVLFGIAMLITVFVYRKKLKKRRPPKPNALLGDDVSHVTENEDNYVRRIWQDCSGDTYCRSCPGAHVVNPYCGDYTQMRELRSQGVAPGTGGGKPTAVGLSVGGDSPYGTVKRVKFVESAVLPPQQYCNTAVCSANPASFATFKPRETVYGKAGYPGGSIPRNFHLCCDKDYTGAGLDSSDSDNPLSPDIQPDLLANNHIEREMAPIPEAEEWNAPAHPHSAGSPDESCPRCKSQSNDDLAS